MYQGRAQDLDQPWLQTHQAPQSKDSRWSRAPTWCLRWTTHSNPIWLARSWVWFCYILYICPFVLILFIRVCANIRNGADGFSPANKYFLACLYPTGRGNQRKVKQYFLRSTLLLKVSHKRFTFFSYFHVPFCRSSVLSSHHHLQQTDSKKLWMGQLVRNKEQQGKRKLPRVTLPPF